MRRPGMTLAVNSQAGELTVRQHGEGLLNGFEVLSVSYSMSAHGTGLSVTVIGSAVAAAAKFLATRTAAAAN